MYGRWCTYIHSDVNKDKAASRLWPLIEAHAAKLRAMELYPHRGSLELWLAPGDSEDNVVNGMQVLEEMPFLVPGAAEVHKSMVGFQGTMYDSSREEGLKAQRDGMGMAIGVDGTDDDYEKLMNMVDGMDMNELYKEQERRAGRKVDE